MKLKAIIFLFVGLFCVAGVCAQKADKQTESVLELLKKYDAAWNKKDASTVAAIIAADYIYFDSRGGSTDRKGTLEFLASPKYTLTFAERTEIKAFRTGETIVITSRWKGRETYDTEEINDDQRCRLVFASVGMSWKLVSENCVQIAPK